jgi:ribosome-associated protein
LAAVAVKTLVAKKALDPMVLDVRGLCGFADYFVICAGASRRMVVALAEYVLEAMAAAAVKPLGSEGMDEGNWVLLDFNDVVINIFNPELREFYNLEGLWAEAPRVSVDRFLKEKDPAPPLS